MDFDELIRIGREADKIMVKQSEYDPHIKTFIAKCAVCGKKTTQKKRWFRSRFATLRELRLQFNFCKTCNRWVCENCFLTIDCEGNSIGSCAECANEQGIRGLTSAQFNEAWPEIERRRNERREAEKRAHLEQS